MEISFSIVKQGDTESITVIIDGEVYSANTKSHGNYRDIRRAALDGDESILDMFDIGQDIERRFQAVSERVAIHDGDIYFDGELADSSLAREIMRHYKAGADFQPLVNFLERLETNPSEHSRKQTWEWVKARNLTITPEGDFIAYKGVVRQPDDTYVSGWSGKAIVDGVEHNGQIPNNPGSVVEMPRGSVTFDPGLGCSSGLHAGTFEYAQGYHRGGLLTVQINPRDVVSVPNDGAGEKLRVSRYKVLDVTEVEYTAPVYGADYEDYDDEDDYWDSLADDELAWEQESDLSALDTTGPTPDDTTWPWYRFKF
jgi:hypothetical protein